MLSHDQKIRYLQNEILTKKDVRFRLEGGRGYSNTTRSKSYNKGCAPLSCANLDQVIAIDLEKKRIWVEPRITMEALVQTTLPLGLLPPIIPEFKGITVGGAVMGAAAESAGHQWGIFHDSCTQLRFLDGKGNLITTSPTQNCELFYALSGSYGSLGLLVAVELQLVPIQPAVQLTYHAFTDPVEGLRKLESLKGKCNFLDGILFSPNHCVIIEGHLINEQLGKFIPNGWFAQAVQKNQAPSKMPLFDYLFRYDQGAFWMGNFLFSLPFLMRYIGEGLLNFFPKKKFFNSREIISFYQLPYPSPLLSRISAPFMSSQKLWWLLHKAEKWVQDRLVIQDFCIPFPNAPGFLQTILSDPAVFPVWLCPIKGTQTPQFLAPHYGHSFYINFGIYGSPGYSAPMQEIIQKLEQKTHHMGGRKVLYSRSFYTLETFWSIYPQSLYTSMRQKTHAVGVWKEITEKILSE
jgi:hypothetical protein